MSRPSGPLLFNPDLLAEAKALSNSFKSSGGKNGIKKGGSSTPPNRPIRVPSPLNYGENHSPAPRPAFPAARPAAVPSRPAAVPVAKSPYVETKFGPPTPQPRPQAYSTPPPVPAQAAAPPPLPTNVVPESTTTTGATQKDNFVKAAMDRFKALGKATTMPAVPAAPPAEPKPAAATSATPRVSSFEIPTKAAPPARDFEAEKRAERAKAAQLQLDQEEEKVYAESRAATAEQEKEAAKASVASPKVPPHLRGKSATASAPPSAASLAIPKQTATPPPKAHQASVEDDTEWVDKMAARKASAKAKEAEELKLKEAQAKEAEEAKAKEAAKVKAKEADEAKAKEAEYRAKKIAESKAVEEARVAAAAAVAAAEAVKPVAGTWETENATVSATFTPLHAKHNDLAVKTKEMLAEQMKAVVEAEHKAGSSNDEVVFRPKEKTVRFDSTPQVFTEPQTNGESSKKRKVEQRTVSSDTDAWGTIKTEEASPANTTGLSKAEVESKLLERMLARRRVEKAQKLADEALKKATADLKIIDADVNTLMETLELV